MAALGASSSHNGAGVGGPAYSPLDSGIYSKEALAMGDAAGTGGEYFDPQGRSGLRYQARQDAYRESMGASAGKGAGKKKWWWIAGVGLLVIGAIVGIAVGVTTANKNKGQSKGGSQSAATTGSNGTTTGGTTQTGDDPSQFSRTTGCTIRFTGSLILLRWVGWWRFGYFCMADIGCCTSAG